MAIYQGTQYSKSFQVVNSAGAAVNITGWEFEAMFRDRNDTEVVLTLTTADGGFTVTDGAAGEFTMLITAAQTAELPKAKLVFDVLRTEGSDPVFFFAGKILVKQPVTRD